MKAISTQQEILLMTGTRFSEREWAEKDPEERNKLSEIEKLEDACWKGLLDEILPEIVEKTTEGKKLFMWHIRQCKSFLDIELGESLSDIDGEFSIDPYLFLPRLFLS
jgi:hypothetical protein